MLWFGKKKVVKKENRKVNKMKTTVKRLLKQGLSKDEIMTLCNLDEKHYEKYKVQGRPVYLENGATEISAINSLKTDNRIEVIEKSRLYDSVFGKELYEGMSAIDKANIIDELPDFLKDIEQHRIERLIRVQKELIEKYENDICKLYEKIEESKKEIEQLNSRLGLQQLQDNISKSISEVVQTVDNIVCTVGGKEVYNLAEHLEDWDKPENYNEPYIKSFTSEEMKILRHQDNGNIYVQTKKSHELEENETIELDGDRYLIKKIYSSNGMGLLTPLK